MDTQSHSENTDLGTADTVYVGRPDCEGRRDTENCAGIIKDH